MIKKNSIYKSTLAAASFCMAFGTIAPFTSTFIQAQEQEVSTTATLNGTVALTAQEGRYTFGNGYLTRTFLVENGHLRTDNVTNYRTDKQTVLTPTSSEEFVIKTMPNNAQAESGVVAPKEKLENKNWQISSDSEDEGEKGQATNMFDGNVDTFYHSKYARNGQQLEEGVEQYPHNIYVSFDKEETFKSIYYKQRVHQGKPTVSGHVNEFKIYKADTEEALKTEAAELVYSGSFEDKEDNYVNLGKEVTAQHVRIEFVSGHEPKQANVNKNVACCSEFGFFKDEAVLPQKEVDVIKSSDLTLNGEPVQGEANGYKTVTFTFNPIRSRNVDYTIKEVLMMKDGESFMRKHLEITVPEEQAEQAKIEYIDLENMDFSAEDTVGSGSNQDKQTNFWTIPEQKNNPDMANMKGDYLELGQPYYVGAMYWGSEFPETENKIRQNGESGRQNGFIRYHYGKNLAPDTTFNNYNNYNNANGQSGKMITWDAVVGAARSTDYQVVQSDFYEYIETIATPTDFRQQFNSWYDNMKNITDENIKQSFSEVEKGFTQNGVNPLDSYVVDDGWINYNSFWDFDRSPSKFPNELYDASRQVNQMGSNFGLWLGPRGGYGTQGTISNYIQSHGLGSKNEQAGDINISDGRYLDKLVTDIFKGYQEKFDINYWKLDGMLLEPSKKEGNYHVTTNALCTISETYERWTDMYEQMRAQRGGKDLWINMTSYTNPSPWHLQWVNSVWMQNTGDSGFNYKFNSSDEEAMLTYRDGDYYDFFAENQWQLPNKYFYNHDPVYAKTAHSAPGGKHPIKYTADELRNHLYMLGTRGTAFWEYYYSPSMFDEDKWDVNAEAANWIQDNFHILQKSKMFGGNPETGDVYGYSCWDGNEGIVSIRNPKDVEQTYELTFDRLIGMGEGVQNVYGKVVVGDQSRQTDEALSYGNKISYTLKPKEVLIVQYGEKDTIPAVIESIHTNENKVNVTFNETIQNPKAANFSVEGKTVESVQLKEDLRTVELTLNEAVKDTADVKVLAHGVKDIVGNESNSKKTDDYYVKDLVNGVKDVQFDGNGIEKGNKYSIDGKGGFSVTGTITTEAKNAEIVSQEGAYSVGIDAEGYLTFTVNGLSVRSQYVAKTRQEDGTVTSETKGILADGKEHQFAAVKEVNGMLKLYIDGELVNSAYDPGNMNPDIQKGNLVFGKGLTGSAEYVTVHDTALGFDDVERLTPEENVERNVVYSKNNKDVKITAYDVTAKKDVPEKSDRPFSMLNDGVVSTGSYLELNDTNTYTSDNKKHSRYVQIDLGDTYTLNKLKLTRYWDGSRKYDGTVILLSEDDTFDKNEVVYNSDAKDVHGFGKGTESLYVETEKGKEIPLKTPTKARYIRIYVNGNANGQSSSDHLVEFEGYGVRTTNPEENRPISPERPDGNVNPGQPNPEKPETGDVNKDRLSALVEESGKLVEKDYTKDSWKNFVVALNQAKDVLSNKEATQEQVDAAVKALEKAKADLKLVGGSITNKPGQQSGTNKPGQQSGTNKPGQKPNKNEGTNTGTRTFASVFGIESIASVGTMLALIEAKRRKMDC